VNLSQGSLHIKRSCVEMWTCCKAQRRIDKKWETFENLSLSELLSHRMGYDLFLVHVKETLCTENLFFFLDIYRLRKSLPHDPFIELSKDSSSVVRSCAMLKMDWIDEEIRKDSTVVPTCKQIYKLYVKPASQMEINIPGWMRQQLVNIFEQKYEKHTLKNKLTSIGNLFFRNSKTVTSRELVSVETPQQWLDSPKVNFWSVSTRRSAMKPKELSFEVSGTKRNTLSTVWTTETDILPFDVYLGSPSTSSEIPIEHLYPAWTTLVNLLNNDSLVRFKLGSQCKCSWRETE